MVFRRAVLVSVFCGFYSQAYIEITNTLNEKLIANLFLRDTTITQVTIEPLTIKQKIDVAKVSSITLETEKDSYAIGWEDVGGQGWSMTPLYGKLQGSLHFNPRVDRCQYVYEKNSPYTGSVIACAPSKTPFDSGKNPIQLTVLRGYDSTPRVYDIINWNGATETTKAVWGEAPRTLLIAWQRSVPANSNVQKTIARLKKAKD